MTQKKGIILGIDPGIVNLGYALVNLETHVVLNYGCCISQESTQEDKLVHIYKEFGDLIRKYKPKTLVFEEPSHIKGQNGPKINEAIGVLKTVARLYGVEKYIPCSPTQLKKAVTGNGKAEKKDIQEAVMQYFKLSEFPDNNHAADALGSIIYYIKK